MPSSLAHANKCSRAAMAKLAVAIVLVSYFGMFDINSKNQLNLCQLGLALTSKGASALNSHLSAFSMVLGWVHTSAFEADN